LNLLWLSINMWFCQFILLVLYFLEFWVYIYLYFLNFPLFVFSFLCWFSMKIIIFPFLFIFKLANFLLFGFFSGTVFIENSIIFKYLDFIFFYAYYFRFLIQRTGYQETIIFLNHRSNSIIKCSLFWCFLLYLWF